MVRAKNAGFTLAELSVATTIGVLALTAVVGTTVATTNVATKLTSGGARIQKAVSSLDALAQDLRDADLLMAKYPPSGTASFQANETNTVILRVPKVTNGAVVADSFDVFIYYLSAASGDLAPQKLTRYTATIVNGNASTATVDRVVACNVVSANFAYGCRETFYGESSYTKFRTRTMPQGDKPGFTQQIFMDGDEMVSSSDAEFDGDLVKFASAPSWGKIVDARYTVDPSYVVTDCAGNNANEVLANLTVKSQWTDRTHTTRSRDILLSTQMQLRNK